MKFNASFFATAALCLTAALVAGSTAAQISKGGFQRRPKLPPAQPVQRPRDGAGPQFGDALPGLSADLVAAFEEGREEFEAGETAAGGLGPIFNGSSCVACHSAGATGGASAVTVTRFGRVTNGQFDPLTHLGGSLLQRFAIAPEAQERVPPEANVVAQRLATPLFGLGLIEALADDDILLNARRPQPDGVHGRAALVTDIARGGQRVGRFGWKAQLATLLDFAGDAYVNEMGITSRLFPTENAPNGNLKLLARFDRVPDVEDAADPATGKSDIDHAADFMRLLAPPPQAFMTASALAGGRVFDRIRCTACHTPVMTTGPNAIAALAHQPVRLFSDLLLHDMGGLGDGIEQAAAKGSEFRTAPLWGLRARAPYLHDGRAATVTDAIRAHQGEGTASRQRFNDLRPAERQQLLDYLNAI